MRQLMFLSPPLSHCSVRALVRTAISRRLLAALLAMPALASSTAHASLITAHSCCTVLSWMSRCGRGCFVSSPSQYLTTALVHLYSLRAVRAKKVLCFAGIFRLICLWQEEITSDQLKWGSPSRFINQPRSLRQRLWPHHEGAARQGSNWQPNGSSAMSWPITS